MGLAMSSFRTYSCPQESFYFHGCFDLTFRAFPVLEAEVPSLRGDQPRDDVHQPAAQREPLAGKAGSFLGLPAVGMGGSRGKDTNTTWFDLPLTQMVVIPLVFVLRSTTDLFGQLLCKGSETKATLLVHQ